ncbi:hypothetical protein [Anabaena sp. FACHB-1250]|uniref:hypothetical protein n=1 Tax=Anabaena sp. FACHB-1250 TaxID=2692770 RepID=UPI001680FAFD|nr:hypothetical protein [Anabaena sp. FACHB-1250]
MRYRTPTPQNSELTSQRLRYRTPKHPQTAIAPNPLILSELLAAALTLSHSQHPQTAIAYFS